MIHTYTAASYYFLHEQRRTTTYYTERGEIVAKSTLNLSRNHCTVSIYKGREIAKCEDMAQVDVPDFIAQNVYIPADYPDLKWCKFVKPIVKRVEEKIPNKTKTPELGTYVLHHFGKHHVYLGTYDSVENAAWELKRPIGGIIETCYNEMTPERNGRSEYFLIVKK